MIDPGLDGDPGLKGASTQRARECWDRARKVFDDALPLTPTARDALLDERCGDDAELRREIESLLAAHDQAGTFIDRPACSREAGAGDAVGRRLGPYRLERLLGRGGMGAVYLACRDDEAFEKRVAVKVLRRGLESDEIVRRFRGERQILASLEHPNIARLIDGGSTGDGLPYLVLEHVEGLPVDRYCDDARLGVRERLRLFLTVCRAVHFAHQNLVVHRDLKPTNILVDAAGVPKLLDFGIAKLLDQDRFPLTVVPTDPGLVPMTPEYASPEQARGERVTTASDVYSLGVLLYELLTGRRPLPLAGLDRPSQLRELCETRPLAPSKAITATAPAGAGEPTVEALCARRATQPGRLRRQLEGDLDTIVLQALRKEPERRYATVESFAGDLERHLAGRPVSARQDSWTYRLGKLVARHRLGFAAAAAAAVALVAFTATLWLQSQRLIREQRKSSKVIELLVGLFESPDPFRGHGERVTAREVLTEGTTDVPRKLRDQPETLIAIEQVIGRSLTNLALYEDARSWLERSYSLGLEMHGEEHPATVESLRLLADLDLHQGRYKDAERRYAESLRLSRKLYRQTSPEVAKSLSGLALAQSRRGASTAGETYGRALAVARQLDGEPRAQALAPLLDHYAELLRQNDEYDRALAAAEEALKVRLDTYGGDHPAVALSLNNLALIVKHDDAGRAEALLVEAERIQRRAHAGPHAHLAMTLINQGRLSFDGRRLEEARDRFEEAAAIQEKVYRGPHPTWATALDLLAGVRANLGELEPAIAQRRQVLDMRWEMFGDDHVAVARGRNNLAKLLVETGRFDEARELYRLSSEAVRSRYGETHRHLAVLLNNRGELEAASGDPAAATRLFAESVEILRRQVAANSPLLAAALLNLGDAARRQGHLEAACELLDEALRIARERWSEESSRTAEVAVAYAALLNDLDDFDQAERTLRPALAVLSARVAAGRPARVRALGELQLGRSLLGQERFGEAAPLLRAGAARLRSLPAGAPWIPEAERALGQLERAPAAVSRGTS